MMELGAQPDKKRFTWATRLLIAFCLVALVVVGLVVANGSAQDAHVDVNEAMMAPTEVAADATVPAHPEFYISVDKDDAQAPEASEEGELTVFEEQAPVDVDEEEKQLDAWNAADSEVEDVEPDMSVEGDNRVACHRGYVGCVRKCPPKCRIIRYRRCRRYGYKIRCRVYRRRRCLPVYNLACRRVCLGKFRACGRVVARVVIASMATGKVMDVHSGSMRRGAPVIQWPIHCGTNQRWNLITSSVRGQYYIQSVKSKLFLDIYGAGKQNGAKLIQWTPHGNGNQRFRFMKTRAGSYWIVAVHSGKALDVPGGSNRNGLQLIQWPRHGGANQQWLLVK